MKDVLVRTGSSLLAAVIGYIVLTVLADALSPTTKVIIAAALGALAFGVSVWAAKSSETKASAAIEVASNLKGRSARIENVRAEAHPGESVKVASNIEVQDAIHITGANVTSKKDAK